MRTDDWRAERKRRVRGCPRSNRLLIALLVAMTSVGCVKETGKQSFAGTLLSPNRSTRVRHVSRLIEEFDEDPDLTIRGFRAMMGSADPVIRTEVAMFCGSLARRYGSRVRQLLPDLLVLARDRDENVRLHTFMSITDFEDPSDPKEG